MCFVSAHSAAAAHARWQQGGGPIPRVAITEAALSAFEFTSTRAQGPPDRDGRWHGKLLLAHIRAGAPIMELAADAVRATGGVVDRE